MSDSEIIRHFRALQDALRFADPAITDRVRDALDRNATMTGDAMFIANTFGVDATLHESERYVLQRLRHRDLGTMHVLKTVRPDCRDDGWSNALLLREARMAMRVQSRHVVPIQTVLRLEDGRPALLMPECGISLAQVLQSQTITADFARQFKITLQQGLADIHAAGIVHCDIAPANLLLQDGDPSSLRICDFGIALEVGERHSDHDLAKAGRGYYASPEQMGGDALDAQADIFAAERVIERLMSAITQA